MSKKAFSRTLFTTKNHAKKVLSSLRFLRIPGTSFLIPRAARRPPSPLPPLQMNPRFAPPIEELRTNDLGYLLPERTR
jgi:hypothetical protein